MDPGGGLARPKSRYHHGDLRRAALDAAVREVDEHGYAAFTVERLARSLGVTAPALYRHFENRDALVRAVIWDVFLRFVAEMDEAVLSAPDAEGVMRALGRTYIRFAVANPGWFRLQFSRVAIEAHPVRHEDAQPRYPEVVFGALGAVFGSDQAAVERRFLLLWGTAHGIAALTVERVWGHVTSEEERLALGLMLWDAQVDTMLAERP